ncbi:potassium channel family protein [Acidobacteriota bacterium]
MWKPFILIVLIILVGTFGYYFIEHMTLLDALYMTMITIFTVGFHEVEGPLSQPGQVFTIFIIIGGVGTALFAFTKFVEVVFEGGLQKFMRRKKMENKLKNITDHYIVCGWGRMGKIVCERLDDEKISFVIIDSNEDRITQIKETTNYLVLQGDANNEEVLLQAGIKGAKGLAALLPSDADNLYLVLTVRLLNPSVFILSKALEDEGEKKILQIGANKVVTPYKLGGLKILHGLIRPTLVEFMDLIIRRKEISLSVEEFIVKKGAKMIGKTLKGCDVRKKANVIVVAIKKPGEDIAFNPSPDMKIGTGDTLLVLGDNNEIAKFETNLLGASP